MSPVLPTEVKVSTERVFKHWDYLVYTATTLVVLVVAALFLGYWFSFGDWKSHPVPFGIMTGTFLLYFFLYVLRWFSLPFMRRPNPTKAKSGWKVGVATTYVPGAEPIDMLEETVRELVAMDYQHETWVLDEGDSDEVKRLCARLGAFHFSRKDLPQYHAPKGKYESRCKHGNYNAWLYEVGFDRFDIVANFDPDHVPQRDFLTQVLGYFGDPSIGYVQAAQVYYNQKSSFIARGAAEETYAYYSSIQMTNYALGYPIVTGCHTTHRVTALKEVEGFAPHAADDLLITLRYREHGWKGVYLPKTLAKGLTPVDWSGFLIQQRRWARSVLDVKFRIYPKAAGALPLSDRIANFVHGLYYLQSIGAGAQIALLAYMLVTGVTPAVFSFMTLPALVFLGLVMQASEFYRQRFFIDPRREIGLHWRSQLLAYAKWPVFLLGLWDVITNHQGPYTITRKAGKDSDLILVLPHGIIAGIIGVAWLAGTVLGNITNPMLELGAFISLAISIGLILTTRMKYPAPYERGLWEGAAGSGGRRPEPARAPK